MGRRSVQSSGLPRVPGLQGSPGFPGSGGVQGALCVPPQGSGKQILELENPGGPGENTHNSRRKQGSGTVQGKSKSRVKQKAGRNYRGRREIGVEDKGRSGFRDG